MPTYNVHLPEARTPAQKAAALKVALYSRSGREVLAIRAFNRDTMRVTCAIEGGAEHTYDYADLLHHLGDAGKRAHFEAAGFPVKNAHVHKTFRPLLDFIGGDCTHGRPTAEPCEDCKESDAEERIL